MASDAENKFQFWKLPVDVARKTDLSFAAKLAHAFLIDWRSSIPLWPGTRKIAEAIGSTRYVAAKAVNELEKTRLLDLGLPEKRKKRKRPFRVSVEPMPITDPTLNLVMPNNCASNAQELSHISDRCSETTTTNVVVVRERQKLITKELADGCYDEDDIPRSEWGRIGKAAQSLARDGLTVEEVAELINIYKSEWPNCTLTPTAISHNVANLRRLKKDAVSDYDRLVDAEIFGGVE